MVDDLVRKVGYLALGTRLRRISELLLSETHSVMAERGIPLQSNHYPVLAALDENGPLTIGNLAAALGVSQPGVTRLVGQLVKIGIVSSVQGSDDQRQKIVALTSDGQMRVKEAREAIWPLIQACVAGILDGQRGPFLDQLDHLEAELRRHSFRYRIHDMKENG